jgi:hypothetical protein
MLGTMKASIFLICAIWLVACSSRPENKLLGKWQSQSSPRYDLLVPMKVLYTQVRLEFFKDGTVVERKRLK